MILPAKAQLRNEANRLRTSLNEKINQLSQQNITLAEKDDEILQLEQMNQGDVHGVASACLQVVKNLKGVETWERVKPRRVFFESEGDPHDSRTEFKQKSEDSYLFSEGTDKAMKGALDMVEDICTALQEYSPY